tara:strand:+ start:2075 stop:2275 length:201 start_codon:yes stop_codon:yes gene_type:complete
MKTIYGTTDTKGGDHIDTSRTLHGAKCYATRNDLKTVSKRVGYNARIVAVKTSLGWINEGSELHNQ